MDVIQSMPSIVSSKSSTAIADVQECEAKPPKGEDVRTRNKL